MTAPKIPAALWLSILLVVTACPSKREETDSSDRPDTPSDTDVEPCIPQVSPSVIVRVLDCEGAPTIEPLTYQVGDGPWKIPSCGVESCTIYEGAGAQVTVRLGPQQQTVIGQGGESCMTLPSAELTFELELARCGNGTSTSGDSSDSSSSGESSSSSSSGSSSGTTA